MRIETEAAWFVGKPTKRGPRTIARGPVTLEVNEVSDSQAPVVHRLPPPLYKPEDTRNLRTYQGRVYVPIDAAERDRAEVLGVLLAPDHYGTDLTPRCAMEAYLDLSSLAYRPRKDVDVRKATDRDYESPAGQDVMRELNQIASNLLIVDGTVHRRHPGPTLTLTKPSDAQEMILSSSFQTGPGHYFSVFGANDAPLARSVAERLGCTVVEDRLDRVLGAPNDIDFDGLGWSLQAAGRYLLMVLGRTRLSRLSPDELRLGEALRRALGGQRLPDSPMSRHDSPFRIIPKGTLFLADLVSQVSQIPALELYRGAQTIAPLIAARLATSPIEALDEDDIISMVP